MKHNRLLWFLCLLLCIGLACKLPLVTNRWGVTDVTVAPHSGTGHFSAAVEITMNTYGEYTLRCYVSADLAQGGNVDIKTIPIKHNTGSDYDHENFPFDYTVPGLHSLVCMIKGSGASAYSDDFVVVGGPILTITASSDTMTEGGDVPNIIPAYSGFVNGDTVNSLQTAPTCTTTATSTSPAGSYPSRCSGAVAGNYTIKYIPGTVTVNPATQPPASCQTPALGQFKTASLHRTDTGVVATIPNLCFTGNTEGTTIPPLTIAQDGSFRGDCKGEFSFSGRSTTYSGTTVGQWNPQTGEVTWTMVVSYTNTDPPRYGATNTDKIIASQGSSSISTASDCTVSAQGKADWTQSCQTTDASDPWCGLPGKETFTLSSSGTLGWVLTFNP